MSMGDSSVSDNDFYPLEKVLREKRPHQEGNYIKKEFIGSEKDGVYK